MTLQTRNNHTLIKFHEIFHKDAPDYLNSLVPPQIYEAHQYNTRRSNNTVYLNCTTFYYQNSFLPSSIKLWNNISNDIRLKSSTYCFKRFLNRICVKNHITLILDHEKSKLFSRAYVSNVAPLKIISFKKILLIQVCVHVEK
jgi:hypothetical protein